jgi:hypothetical protein
MSGESTKLPIVIRREVRRDDALRPAGAAGDAIAFPARIDRAHVLTLSLHKDEASMLGSL